MTATSRPQDADAASVSAEGPRTDPWADPYALLESIADGVVVLRRTPRGLVVDWTSRRFLSLAELTEPPVGEPPGFLYCHAENRSLADHAPDCEFPPEFRLAIRTAGRPVCLIDAVCRPYGADRLVLTCTRTSEDGPFRALVDVPLPAIAFDAAMRIRWLNAVAADTIGLPAAELIGRDWYAFMPEARDRTALHADALSTTDVVRSVDAVPMTFPAQATRWFRVHYRSYRNAAGEIAGVVAIAEETTGRRAAELALLKTRESLRLAVESARMGFFEYDVERNLLEPIDEYYTMRGKDPAAERARGPHPNWDDVHPDDLPHVQAELARIVADPQRRPDTELRLRTGDGGWLWVLLRGRALAVGTDGRATRLAGLVVDVDHRKRMEHALAQSEARYRSLVAVTPGLLHESEYAADGRFVVRWASEGLERLLGWTAEELNARGGWSAVIHPDDLVEAEARRARMFAGEQTRSEVRLLTKSGAYVWMTVSATPLADPQTARIRGVLGAMYDVTHLKDTEAALRRSEERFRLAAEAFNGIIYDYDAATGITTRSRGVREVLGYEPEQLSGELEVWQRLIHPDDRARLVLDGSRSEPGRNAIDQVYRVRHADGHWVEVWDRALLARDSEGRLTRAVGCSIDVTNERRFQRMLAEAESVAHVGSWEYDVRTRDLMWSPEAYRIHELDAAGGITVERAFEFYGAESRVALTEAVQRCHDDGEAWELDLELVTARGRERWVRISGRAEVFEGHTVRLYGAVLDIDTLKRAQVQLQRQGDWLRMSIDASNLTAWRWYPDRDEAFIEYRSPSMQPAMIQQPTLAGWLESVDPEHRERLATALLRTAEDGTRTHEEYRAVRPGAAARWFVTRAVRSQDAGGPMVIGTTQDVTARREADDRLRASEAVLRSVADNSPDFITIVDPGLTILFVNRPVGPLSPDQLVGRPLADLVLGDAGATLAKFREVFANGAPQHFEQGLTMADGEYRHYQHRVSAIRDAEKVAGAIIHTTDITERRAADRRLRAQASVLATMLEGVAVVDASGSIHLTNPAFDRMFGYETGALDGHSFKALLASDVAPPDECATPFGFPGRRADGSDFDATTVATRLELGGERYTVHVVQDVTERRALERELLEISNREQRRIGSDLHDGLGQELTGVALMLRGLASRVKRGQAATPGDLDELVALVNGAIESTRSLARGLSPIELERGGLVYALRALAVRARDLYGLDVRFRSRVWPALTLEPAATTHLYRIAQESLTNAARHAQATHVAISLNVRGSAVTLTVADDGRGLAPEAGGGMGLKIMRYRAQMMGGELTVGAGTPGGVRVTCRVPQPDPFVGAPA
jgi:PAS domain S-box-containing protein